MSELRIHAKHIKRVQVQSQWQIQRPALQELRQAISRQCKMRFTCPVKHDGNLLRRSSSGYGGRESKRASGARTLKGRRNCKADDLQEMIATLRSQYEKVKTQAAFLELKQSELRPGDEISFFWYLQAKEHLHIEQSLLSGHAYMVRQILAKRKRATSPEIGGILREIEAATYCRSCP